MIKKHKIFWIVTLLSVCVLSYFIMNCFNKDDELILSQENDSVICTISKGVQFKKVKLNIYELDHHCWKLINSVEKSSENRNMIITVNPDQDQNTISYELSAIVTDDIENEQVENNQTFQIKFKNSSHSSVRKDITTLKKNTEYPIYIIEESETNTDDEEIVKNINELDVSKKYYAKQAYIFTVSIE